MSRRVALQFQFLFVFINMNSSVWHILLGLGLILPTCLASSFDPELICTLVVDGTKMNDPRVCNGWIQCVDGKPVSGTCDDGLFYDRQTEDCVPSADTNCISSDPCAAQPNGFAADPYSCNGYYYCKQGVGTRGVCNNGLNYNPGTESCIRDFPCTAKMNPDSYCNILPDGVFAKDTLNCNGWQMCWKGEVINGTCPATFYFSAAKGDCDYPQNVECAITEPPPLTAAPEACPKAGSFISDESSCNGYYYCRESSDGQMQLQHGECDDGRFFSARDGGACVPRSKLQCDYDRCVDLGYTGIQLANESNDGCTGFAICQDGVKIGEGTCPNGEYFDELTQRCTNQVISYPACALSSQSTTQTTAA
ncbi:peritrophin-48 [Drosophila novamexicana]|uniref:peritrophin-48 n=1 Tax=Drosophila novamexicana TaxID=47314 RepID=UPI0011E590B6|nr:peritrophin-48 [Drosophila novamexicana]